MRGKKPGKHLYVEKLYLLIYFSHLYFGFFLYDVYVTYILKTLSKKIGKSIRIHKRTMNSIRLKLPGGVCRGPLILVSVACAPATSQSLSPHLPYFSLLKKRAGFPLKNLCFLPPPTQGANRHERLSLRSKKISLFTNSHTIWANCKFFSEEI